jgi:hypothetical protein
MNNFKILTTRGRYEDTEIECSSPEQLSNQDRIIIANEMTRNLNSDDQLKVLNNLSIDKKTFEKYAKDLGYLPATRVEAIPEAQIVEPNRVYFNNAYASFETCGTSTYNKEAALLHKGKFFVEIKLGPKHPFSIAQKNFQAKKEKEKADRLAKKKEKEVEKAKKVLAEFNGLQ